MIIRILSYEGSILNELRKEDIYWGTKVWNIDINFVVFKK